MTLKPAIAMAALAASLLVSACAQFDRTSLPQAAATDDDAMCRKEGEPGSQPYVACRRDRDVAASRASRSEVGVERAHKNLANDMLNGR
ncbi:MULTISPECIES: hypothetical protein [Afipia]|nr:MULTISPECIES: hypothetical protein [Afipia]